MNVSRETEDRFAPYCDLLRRWTTKISLVAPSTLATLHDRHVADCLQVVPLIPPQAQHIVDLGSGAGLPGLIVATALQDLGRSTRMTLIESDQRKCAFLAEAARVLEVHVDIRADRILNVPPLAADVVMARALAPLHRLLDYQRHHGAPGSVGIYLKGARHAEEVRLARDHGWRINVNAHDSTSPESALLTVRLDQRET